MHLAHGSVDPQKLVGFCGDFDETEVGYQNSTILSPLPTYGYSDKAISTTYAQRAYSVAIIPCSASKTD